MKSLCEFVLDSQIMQEVHAIQFFGKDFVCYHLRDGRGSFHTTREHCKFGIYNGRNVVYLDSNGLFDMINHEDLVGRSSDGYFNIISVPLYNILRHFRRECQDKIANLIYNYRFDYEFVSSNIIRIDYGLDCPISCSKKVLDRDVWKYEMIYGRVKCKGTM